MLMRIAALSAAVMMMGAPAMAARSVTAKLQAPGAGVKKPIAGGAVFTCEADTCLAVSGYNTVSPAGCRELVRAVGAVTSFGDEAKQFDADKLARCNAGAKK